MGCVRQRTKAFSSRQVDSDNSHPSRVSLRERDWSMKPSICLSSCLSRLTRLAYTSDLSDFAWTSKITKNMLFLLRVSQLGRQRALGSRPATQVALAAAPPRMCLGGTHRP